MFLGLSSSTSAMTSANLFRCLNMFLVPSIVTIKSGHCCVLWLFLEEILSLHWLAYWCSYLWTLLHCILLGKFGVMHVEIVNKCLFLVEETGLVVLRAPLSVVQCWTAVWLGRKFLNPVMGKEDSFQVMLSLSLEDHVMLFSSCLFLVGETGLVVQTSLQ